MDWSIIGARKDCNGADEAVGDGEVPVGERGESRVRGEALGRGGQNAAHGREGYKHVALGLIFSKRFRRLPERYDAIRRSPSGHGDCDEYLDEFLVATLGKLAAKSPEIDKVIAQATNEIARELPSLRRAAGGSSPKNSNRSPHTGKANGRRITALLVRRCSETPSGLRGAV